MLDSDPPSSQPDLRQTSVRSDGAVSGRLSGCGILIVEADPAQRKLIHRFLESEGACIRTTSGSAEAVVLLFAHNARDEDTDIVLLNANLPDVRDVEAVGRLRDGGFRRTIIAMAWQKDAANRDALISAGYDEVIIKPIQREELVAILEGHINRRSSVQVCD